MQARENVTLAPYTTFRVGGSARFFVETHSVRELAGAAAFARAQHVPLRVLGKGSNLLVPDEGIDAVVVRLATHRIRFESASGDTLLIADAGARFDDVVDAAAREGLWGVENLAGIPGTVGGAAVQNIGAYGTALEDVFAYADTYDPHSGKRGRVVAHDAQLGYRTSCFKRAPGLVITRVALRLTSRGCAQTAYADLAHARESGIPLDSPRAVARAVRAIRAGKFPDLSREGTAGSFWKNPVLPRAQARELSERFPELPCYPQGTSLKVSLGWLLDHALGQKGHREDGVRLYENQALVVVATPGTSARRIDAFARTIEARVQEALGITLEREVERFGA